MKPRTRPILAAAAACLLLLSACGDSTSPEFTPVGRYVLLTVDGQPVPVVTIQSQSGTIELFAGAMELEEGDSCVGHRTLRETFLGQVTFVEDTEACIYRLDGPDLTVEWEMGGTDTGILEGDRLTLITLGIHLVFER